MENQELLEAILKALQNANELKKVELEMKLADSQYTGDQFRSFTTRLNDIVD